MVADIIIIAAIVVIVGGAVAYIVRAKKSGKKCIGCPDGAGCSSKGCSCCCGSFDENSHPAETDDASAK